MGRIAQYSGVFDSMIHLMPILLVRENRGNDGQLIVLAKVGEVGRIRDPFAGKNC